MHLKVPGWLAQNHSSQIDCSDGAACALRLRNLLLAGPGAPTS
jgi:hypothetical protein